MKKDTVFYIVFFGFILIRLAFAVCYLSSYTDSDQLLFALMGNDYSQGIFHLPLTYGQAYNLPFESWLAVPLLWMNIPWNYAMPVAAGLLGMLPFLVIAILYKKNGNVYAAIFILFAAILLCPEWQYLTSIPRGFTGGLALLIAGISGLKNARKNIFIFLWASIAIIALFFSPNIFPALLLWMWIPGENKISKIWGWVLIAFYPIYYLFSIIGDFFRENPWAIIHPSPSTNWSMNNIANEIGRLPKHFYGTGLIFPIAGVFFLLLFVYTNVMYIRKKEWAKGISSGLFMIAILVLLGFDKTADGSVLQDLPLARFWLFIPLAGILFTNDIRINKFDIYQKITLACLCLLAVGNWVLYFAKTKDRIAACKTVEIYDVHDLNRVSIWLKQIREKQKVNLVMLADGGQFTYLNAMTDPEGIYYYPVYERKTWIKKQWENTLPKTFLYMHKDPAFSPPKSDNYNSLKQGEMHGWMVWLIHENKLGTYKFKETMRF